MVANQQHTKPPLRVVETWKVALEVGAGGGGKLVAGRGSQGKNAGNRVSKDSK